MSDEKKDPVTEKPTDKKKISFKEFLEHLKKNGMSMKMSPEEVAKAECCLNQPSNEDDEIEENDKEEKTDQKKMHNDTKEPEAYRWIPIHDAKEEYRRKYKEYWYGFFVNTVMDITAVGWLFIRLFL